jgi:hypothetical protein
MPAKCYLARNLQPLRITRDDLKPTLCSAIAILGLAALSAPATAAEVTFLLSNASSYSVKSLYTSPVGAEGWDDDLFGDHFLPAGNQVPVTVADGRQACVYHLRFVLEDDSEFVESGINLCELDEYTLSNAQ